VNEQSISTDGLLFNFINKFRQNPSAFCIMKDMVHLTGSHDTSFISLRYLLVRRKWRHCVLGSSWTVRGLNPCRGKIFTSSPQWTVFGTSCLLFSGYRGYLRGLMRPESEVDYSSPSRDVVKNEWSCASSPP
jgi:hypothetical protein